MNMAQQWKVSWDRRTSTAPPVRNSGALRMFSVCLLGAIVALSLVLPAEGAAEGKYDYLNAFSKLPVVRDMELSPDGTYLAVLRNVGNHTVLMTQEIGVGKPNAILKCDNKELRINWFRWVNNDRLIVSALVPVDNGRVVFYLTRLMSLDKTGEDTQIMVKPKRNINPAEADYIAQFQDRVIDTLPDDPDNVLIALNAGSLQYPGVYKASVTKSKKKMVQDSLPPIRNWMTDQQSRIRVGWGYDDETRKVMVKSLDDGTWRTLWENRVFDANAVYPEGFALDPNILYVTADHEGRDALFKVDLRDPKLTMELIQADPEYDVWASMLYSRKTRDAIGYRYYAGRRTEYVYFDKTMGAFKRAIDKAIPDSVNHFVHMSQNQRRYIVFSNSQSNPGTYFFGDLDQKSLMPIAQQYPGLDASNIAGKEEIHYTTRDGLEIQGFLTRPKHLDSSKPLPTVIHPHGGPQSRDTAGFDYWTEFLASRGYVVLQMNFRGSAGFGKAFSGAGLQAWGLQMQDDVIDGTKWLIEEKIADPERICIVGASYGGYAALLGATYHPELYQCAVSYAGVTDLRTFVTDQKGFIDGDIVEEQIGDIREHKDQFAQTSPVRIVSNLKVPVLIAHGNQDRVVPYKHAKMMRDALEAHHKPHEFLELEFENHNLSIQENRIKFFAHVEKFLAKHIGGSRADTVTMDNLRNSVLEKLRAQKAAEEGE